MYLDISPYTAYRGSPRFAKPFLTILVCLISLPHVAIAPIAAPAATPTPAAPSIAVDAASDTTLKACRINPVVDERLHCTLHVMVVVVAYVARHIVFLPVGPVRSISVL